MTGFRASPTRQVRLYQEVADQLREAILSEQFRPGDRLPIETELAAQFGVSRAVVRQATLNLEHEGLVTVLVGAGGGTFVTEPDPLPVLRALENYFRHRGVPFEDYLHAKRILEPTVLNDIMRFSDGAHRERLKASTDEFARAIDNGSPDGLLLTRALDFHEILISEVGNPVLELVLGALVRLGDRVPEFRQTRNPNWEHILEEHRGILKALEDNNAREFRAFMLEHLESVEHIYGDDHFLDPAPAIAEDGPER
ncbi:FadR family transcriptional regulator [Gordonia sp. zg691]|uniref:FadR family transcriptional regulator n=1 Tax=Gordonia jinghuaiqii TaxID=2758710 RepID=A0A7D7QY40_9ACTN|nr:GntR family transcriptional regulator [Gordonia jinghuaiqii]MBD0863049.1 FadR family transcriptional regulator [Gordonia jinghuaiqii]MCR5978823.1 GntR family transcriptional regulator [Gordonia jinghuaiqii]QMT01828.1 FadR family transcriptional regulator [Gordonia jinghuaiqii]